MACPRAAEARVEGTESLVMLNGNAAPNVDGVS